MAIKYIDKDDMYVVRMMFACGHGHALPPGFTHWESGEACIFTHSQETGPGYGPGPTTNESDHYYGRLMLVPMFDLDGKDIYDKLCDNPNKFGHFPLAPEGLQEGQQVGNKIKLRTGAKISPALRAKYHLVKPRYIRYDPPPRAIENAA